MKSSVTKTPIATIIPTFNGRRLLEKHLPSVLKAMRHLDELIIIDDASQDETANWLKYGFSLTQQRKPSYSDAHGTFEVFQGIYGGTSKKIAVTVIVNDANLRFAASVNRAVTIADKELFFLVNSDVSLTQDTINALVNSYTSNAQPIFAVGCLEHEGDSEQAPIAGKNKLWFEKGYFTHSKAEDFSFGNTAWASGGSSLFNRSRWLELGGFDERYYPAYWEDIDISFRARQKGWQILFEPTAVVFHQHESTNKSAFSAQEIDQLSWRHASYFVHKHGSLWQRLQYYFWQPFWMWKRFKS